MNRFRNLPSYHYEDNIDGMLNKSVGKTLRNYKIYGNSVQNTKNIINADSLTKFDKQTDGSYLSNTIINTSYNIIENLKGIYTISVKVKCPTGTNYRLEVEYTDGTKTNNFKNSTGAYINFEFTTNGKDIKRVFWDYSSQSDQIQFKDLQIVLSAPTPEVPIEIESVGKKTENLFNNKVILTNATGNIKDISSTKTGVKFTATTTAGQINAIMGLAKNFVGKTLVFSSPSYYNTVATSFSIRASDGTYITGGTDWAKYDDVYYAKITIPENAEYTTEELCLRLYFSGMKAGDVIEYKDIMVVYGDTLKPYVPYGYMLPIKTVGKNLFDKDNLQNGYMTATGFVQSSWYNCSNYMLIKPNTNYYFSGVPTSTDMGAVRWYDKNKNYISSSVFNTDEGTAKSPTNAYYCIVNVVAHKKGTTQVELGTSKSKYEPYIETVTEIYIGEPLRKIRDYADYIDYKNQKIIRKIASKTFNGTEKYSMFASGSVNYFRTSIDELKYYPQVSGGTNLSNNGLCNYYPVKQSGARGNYTLTAGASNLITFDFGNNDFANATEFKNDVEYKYLDGKPIEVCVVSYEAMEEDIELPTMATQKGTNTIEIDTNIQPSAVQYQYYKGGR